MTATVPHLLLWASVALLFSVGAAESTGDSRDAGAESQFIEISSHNFAVQHPLPHLHENAGRMMRRQRLVERQDDKSGGDVDADAAEKDAGQATQPTRILTGFQDGGARLDSGPAGDDASSGGDAGNGTTNETGPDVQWGEYKFTYLSGTKDCWDKDAKPEDAQSFFELWSGTDLGLTIDEGTTVQGGVMKQTPKGLRIYKAACDDDTTLTVGGSILLPVRTQTIELIFGIIERCTGNCAPFMVSLWKEGKKKFRWCWNHEGHQTKVVCDLNYRAMYAKWTRVKLNITEYTDFVTPLTLALEVYTSGDFRLMPALPDELGVGGRTMVLVDSLVLGPVERPEPDSTYLQVAKPCRPTLMQVCTKDAWCFDKYRCYSGWCIEGNGRCNNMRNCPDDSDEVGCQQDMGFLGEYYLNHARYLQDEKASNFAIFEGLKNVAPDYRLLKEAAQFDDKDLWEKFHVKEFFAVKYTGNLTVTEGGHYFFHFKGSGKMNVTVSGLGENAGKNYNVTTDSWINMPTGIWEVQVLFVHRRGVPELVLEYFGEDTIGKSIAIPPESVKTTMTGSRCDTMMCAASESLANKRDDIKKQAEVLCSGVPCSESHDTATCCTRKFKVIAAGDYQTCALDQAGRPVCWGSWKGYNEEWKHHPGPYRDISTRKTYTCAILEESGMVECWTMTETQTPWVDYSAGGTFINVTVGGDHTCALRDSGFPACTGTDTDKQTYPPSNVEFVKVAAGSKFTCGIEFVDLSVKCWGSNDRGQARPPSGWGHYSYSHLAAGNDHVCGISNGTAYCWGENNNGQASAPAAGLHVFAEVAPGGTHTCALTTLGEAVCWGANGDGQAEPLAEDGPFEMISSGKKHTCAIKSSDYAVACWGSNFEDSEDGGLEWRGQAEPPLAAFWPN